MIQEMRVRNSVDEQGHPAGGYVKAKGLDVQWQDGPLEPDSLGRRPKPNGAFVETLIRASMSRLQFYQASDFACQENEEMLFYLGRAMDAAERRTRRRTEAGVEGSHQVMAGERGGPVAPEPVVGGITSAQIENAARMADYPRFEPVTSETGATVCNCLLCRERRSAGDSIAEFAQANGLRAIEIKDVPPWVKDWLTGRLGGFKVSG